MFQDGPIAAAVNKVTAQGVTYLTSAGNNNNNISGKEEEVINQEGKEGKGTKGVRPTTSWETPQFREAAKEFCPIPVGAAARHCLDFNPAAGEEDNKFGFKIPAGEPVTVALSWAEPWYGVKSDLDLYLLRRRTPQSSNPKTVEKEEEALESPIFEEEESGAIKIETPDEELQDGETEVVAESHLGNVGGKPAESVAWAGNPQPEAKQEQLYLVINRCYGNVCDPNASATALPRLKLVFLQDGLPILSTEYSESKEGDVVGPTIFGHNGAASAVTAGANRFYKLASDEDPQDEPVEHPGEPEKYSSQGPVAYYYAPVTSTTPAPALPAPETVEKPDIVATDCGANTFFGRFFLGFPRFCGTSAAAPHAAGVASIMHQASPTKTPAQIKAALKSTAEAVPTYPASKVGKGLIRAVQAIEALGPFGPINDPPSTLVTPVKPVPPTPPAPPTPEPPAVTPPPGTNPISKSEPTKPHGSGSGAPTTTIKSHPPKMVKSRVGRVKLKFLFASNQQGAKFECSVDKGKWSKCGASYKAYFLLGRHELKVRAVGGDGTADSTPAVFSFTVKLVA
jgi:subtilisin family serine protease